MPFNLFSPATNLDSIIRQRRADAAIVLGLEQAMAQPQLPSYAVAMLPDAAIPGRMIFVTDEAGGAVPAFSDGTDWRRVTDRNVVA